MKRTARQFTGLAGEFYVMAALYQRGWQVWKSHENAADVDLIAKRPEKNFHVEIQVKALRWGRRKEKKSFIVSEITDGLVWIFVWLPETDAEGVPEFFIATSKEIKKIHYSHRSGQGNIRVPKLEELGARDAWDKLLKA